MSIERITERHRSAEADIALEQGARRPGWQELVASGLYHLGALRVVQSLSRCYELRKVRGRMLPRWRTVSGSKLVILCYHRVGGGGLPLFSAMPAEAFEAQMRFLRKRYRIVSFDELYGELRGPGKLDQAVAITFDDGYRDLYSQAFPILRRYRIPATVYLTVGSIETGEAAWYDRLFVALQLFPGSHLEVVLERPLRFQLDSPGARFHAALEIIRRLRALPDGRRRGWCATFEKQIPVPPGELANCMLTWEQIKAMHQEGIAFGSHTMTHPVFSRVPPADMERELLESKQVLESRIGSPVRDFAYPFGKPSDYGPGAGELLAHCGYRTAVTTTEGVNAPGVNPYALRRTQLGEERSLAMFALKLNQLFLGAAEEDSPIDAAASSAEEGALRLSERIADQD